MAPVGEIHAQDRIPGFEDRKIDRHVGLNPRMGLDIGVLRPEELLAPFDGQPFHHVDELAPPIVAATGITFGVLVGHHTSLGFQDCLADEVLRCDHLEFFRLSPCFLADGLRDLRVGLHEIRHVLVVLQN
jgi:hypothetical protein